MASQDSAPSTHAEIRAQWRDWLSAHHATETGVWLVSWRTPTGRPAVSYEDAVCEALCFGWVDSKKTVLDAERSRQYFTPRKPGGGRARTNKVRVVALREAGLMTPAGEAVIDQAVADGTWTLLDDVEDLVIPPDLADAFAGHPGSLEHWNAFTHSARRLILVWIVTAKRPETRATRVEQTARAAAENRKSVS